MEFKANDTTSIAFSLLAIVNNFIKRMVDK